jgi:hypothetical protein
MDELLISNPLERHVGALSRIARPIARIIFWTELTEAKSTGFSRTTRRDGPTYAASLILHIEAPDVVDDHGLNIFENLEMNAEKEHESNSHGVLAKFAESQKFRG